MRKRNDMER
jgi:hypothetical protein